MPSLKDLKVRIKSVKSTQKITKAMKVVAASKLRRARDAAEASRPYAEGMAQMVARLASGAKQSGATNPLLVGTGRSQTHLLVVATSDRGLCGAFNSSILRSTRRKIRELKEQGKQVYLYTVGRKARDLLQQEFGSLFVGGMTDVARKTVELSTAEKLSAELRALIETRHIDVISLVYNHFKSAISQVVTWQQLMPLQSSESGVQSAGTTDHALNSPYGFEPSEEEILAELLPKNFTIQIFKALLESAASEQGARMNAMENATKNAGEMIKKLTLKYNRTRQANITKELIEIISGAEAI